MVILFLGGDNVVRMGIGDGSGGQLCSRFQFFNCSGELNVSVLLWSVCYKAGIFISSLDSKIW